jgi:hypothetical protein
LVFCLLPAETDENLRWRMCYKVAYIFCPCYLFVAFSLPRILLRLCGGSKQKTKKEMYSLSDPDFDPGTFPSTRCARSCCGCKINRVAS